MASVSGSAPLRWRLRNGTPKFPSTPLSTCTETAPELYWKLNGSFYVGFSAGAAHPIWHWNCSGMSAKCPKIDPELHSTRLGSWIEKLLRKLDEIQVLELSGSL